MGPLPYHPPYVPLAGVFVHETDLSGGLHDHALINHADNLPSVRFLQTDVADYCIGTRGSDQLKKSIIGRGEGVVRVELTAS
jgi:hypothetical protein